MALSRYTFTGMTPNRKGLNRSYVSTLVYRATASGRLKTSTKILEEGERLDQIAGAAYGDGTLWWMIAAASGIGWSLQVPPGTMLFIPTNPNEVYSIIS